MSLNEQPPAEPASAPGIAAASAVQKLPPFWSEQPKLWFIQIESIFQISRITRDETKYSHVIANLDPAYLKFVGDILMSPPEIDKYEAIKTRLISSFSVSEEAKLRQLFSGLNIGDMKPSHFLQSMKTLAAGNNVGDNVLKTLFLEQLPDNIRSILAASNLNLSELALQADKIMEIARPQILNIGTSDTISELIGKIEALDRKFETFSRGRDAKKSIRAVDIVVVILRYVLVGVGIIESLTPCLAITLQQKKTRNYFGSSGIRNCNENILPLNTYGLHNQS